MRIRAFLALNFSVAVTRRIAEEVERRRERVQAASLRVAWVPAANLHLTLKFLGTVPEESLEAVSNALRRRLAEHAPLEVSARGLGAFPSLDRPRVLWAGVEGGEPLARLAAEVEAQTVGLGFDPEDRPFHAHVTVGRVKSDGAAAAFREVWSAESEFGASKMTEVVLYESRNRSEGAEYLARARVPLGKSQQLAADG